MVPPRRSQPSHNQLEINLAILAIKNKRIRSAREATSLYNVSESTPYRKRSDVAARRDCVPNTEKITEAEEGAIIEYIFDLNLRRFPRSLPNVRDIVDKLPEKRDSGYVGKLQPNKPVSQTSKIKCKMA